MAQETIDSLIGQKAFDEVARLEKSMDGLIDKFVKSAGAAKLFDAALSDAKSVKDIGDGIKQQKQAYDELDKIKRQLVDTQKKLVASQTIEAQLLAEQKSALRDVTAETNNYVKINHSQEGSVDQMRGKLEVLRKQFYALSEAMRLGGEGQKMLAEIQKLDSAVKMATFSTGKFTDNVGNYGHATFQLTQTLRELPAFAYSTQTGILGISNNLPILMDAFKKVRMETGSAWQALKIFGGSLFSIGNIAAVAIGLFTIYSDKIFASSKSAKQLTATTKELEDASRSAQESVGQEIVKMEELYRATTNTNLSMKDRKAAVDELQKLYPSYFGNLRDEAILAGQATEAYYALSDALLKKAMYEGISAQISEIGKGMAPLLVQLSQVNKQIDDLKASGQGVSINGYYVSGANQDASSIGKMQELEESAESLRSKLTPLRKQLNDLFSTQSLYATDLTRPGYGKPEKKKREKEDPEDTIDKIKKQYDAEKALLETKMRDEQVAEENQYSRLWQLASNYRKKLSEQSGLTLKEKQDQAKLDDDLSKAEFDNHQKILKWLEDETAAVAEADDAKLKSTLKRLEEIKKLNAQYAKDELDLIKENLEAQQRDWDNVDKKREEALRKRLALFQALGDVEQSITGAISAISDIQHDKELSQIEERDKILQNSYENEKKAIEASGLSKEKKEKELAALEARREQERKAAERERVASARRNAQRQKQLDVANIITTTALAIMSALSRVKTDGPVAYAQAIAVGITGAAQLARAIAAPLPQYNVGAGVDGKPAHKGGLAVLHSDELVIEPSGKVWETPAGANIFDLPKNTKVFNQAQREAMMESVYRLAFQKMGDGQKVNTNTMQHAMIDSFNELTQEMKGVKKEIRNLKLGLTLEGDFANFLTMKKIIS